jgi:lipopolysaccharide biosynthesis protein
MHAVPNANNDFAAWAWAIQHNAISEDTETLLLTSDRILGPFFNLKPIFDDMTSRQLDFWGLMESHQKDWHIPSYLLYFNRKAFSSDEFKIFFRKDFSFSSSEVGMVQENEINLSKSLRMARFKGEGFVRGGEFITADDDKPDISEPLFWRDFLQTHQFPFVPRNVVIDNQRKFNDVLELFSVIEDNSDYDIEQVLDVLAEPYQAIITPKTISHSALVLCHLFFPDMAMALVKKLQALKSYGARFVFNLSGVLVGRSYFQKLLRRIFPGCIIVCAPNVGRDIGGKLFALETALQLGIESDITLIIHDKKSLHLGEGELWRDELLKIIEPSRIKVVDEVFTKKSDVGIVGTKRFIQDEYDGNKKVFLCTSNKQINFLLKKYDINTNDYRFVAGNIFWIRSSLLKKFFLRRSPMQIRSELEKGNTLDFDQGTFVHSWERIMSWMATSEGYKIYGI